MRTRKKIDRGLIHKEFFKEIDKILTSYKDKWLITSDVINYDNINNDKLPFVAVNRVKQKPIQKVGGGIKNEFYYTVTILSKYQEGQAYEYENNDPIVDDLIAYFNNERYEIDLNGLVESITIEDIEESEGFLAELVATEIIFKIVAV